MKIKSLYIDGFGKFHNWKPPVNFSEGLTVCVGPNEAGKTTLLAFIRRMLYGFPDGRSNLNHYLPINGGEVGGRLEILGEDGEEYILSRTGTRSRPSITYADGTSASGLTPLSLLGPCDQVFYQNVCAFGLYELQEISTLKKKEIRDRLASAGAGNLPVREVADSLKKSADAIYVRYGKKKEINVLVSELRGVEDEIRKVKGKQGEYDQINEDIAKKNETVAEERKRQKAIEDNINYFRALEKAWDIFVKLTEWRESLCEIPPIKPFPVNALEELGRIEVEIQNLEKECKDLNVKHRSTREELERCEVREEVLDQADTIHALERKIGQYQSQKDDRKKVQSERKQQQSNLDKKLKSLGAGWDEEQIIKFDTSVPAQDDVKELRKRLAQTENDCAVQRSQLEIKERGVEEKRESLRELERQRGEIGDVDDPDTARERYSKSRELLGKIRHIKELNTQLSSTKREEAIAAGSKASLRPAQPLPLWPGVLVMLSTVLVLVWGHLTDTLLIAGAIALILLIAAASIFLAGRKKVGENSTEGVVHPKEGVKTLAEQRKEIEREISEQEKIIRSCATSLGLDTVPSQIAAEDLVNTYDDAIKKSERAYDLDTSISNAKEACSRAESSLRKAQEMMAGALSEREDALDAWKRWCRERNLPESMDPELIPDLIADIRQAAGLYMNIIAMDERREELSKDIQSFEDEIIAVAKACNEPLGSSPDVILEGLIRLLDQEEESKRRRDTLTEQLNEVERALESASAKCNEARERLDDILNERGAKTPEEYRERECLSRERQELEKSIRDAESEIKRISGEEGYHDFIKALEEYDPISMQTSLEEKGRELKEMKERIDDILKDIGMLKERRSGIEDDNDLTQLLSREAALREDIGQMSRQWAVYSTASSLLKMAVETFERERQPMILQEAQSFFTGITNGRYSRVVKPLDGSDSYIEEATGAQKKVDELSRGTAEQLYLSLRFGYIRDYANSSIPVPVIFDDILVNFDPVRRKNACRAIAELAETCQVIYFTCHPQIARDLTEVTPDTVVMDISAE